MMILIRKLYQIFLLKLKGKIYRLLKNYKPVFYGNYFFNWLFFSNCKKIVFFSKTLMMFYIFDKINYKWTRVKEWWTMEVCLFQLWIKIKFDIWLLTNSLLRASILRKNFDKFLVKNVIQNSCVNFDVFSRQIDSFIFP